MKTRRRGVWVVVTLFVLVLAGTAFSKGSIKKAAKLMESLFSLPAEEEFDSEANGLNPKKIPGGWPTLRAMDDNVRALNKSLETLSNDLVARPGSPAP